MIPEPTFRLSRIEQIAVTVKDVDRAVAFYRDVLGVPHLFNAGPLAFFDCEGVRLMLTTPETPEFDRRSSVLYFTVPDIWEGYRTLSDRGVEFVDGPHVVHRTPSFELWMAFFRDTEENIHALSSTVPLSAA